MSDVQVQRVMSGRRVSIPDSVSKEIGLKEGDYVIVEVEGHSVRLVPAEIKPRKNATG